MTDQTEIDRRVQALAERLEARGCWVSLDMRVREPVAAEVLGVTGRTLQRWREADYTDRGAVTNGGSHADADSAD